MMPNTRRCAMLSAAILTGALLMPAAEKARAAERAQPRAAKGPRLTDAELFDALDLKRKGLAPVREAVEAGKLDAAQAALAAYLRGRKGTYWWFDPHHVDRRIRHNKAAADRTVRGTFRVIGIDHTFKDGRPDWFYNPTVARKDLAVNYEWQWQLGRMGYWYELGRTYWATGDEKYARTFAAQLRSWATNCPRPREGSGNVAHSAWRTIECGIRMRGSWPDAYHRFLKSPSFTDEHVILYLKCCIEHAMHLRAHHRGGGNWLTMEMAGLYTVGAVFPELKSAAAWRKYAIGVLHRELNRQFAPDGAQIELTPGYHQVALRNTLHVPELAERLGRTEEIPDDFIARAQKAFAYNLLLMTPDRDLPRFNDSWHCNVPATMRDAVKLFPRRADFAWAASGGREGKPPEVTSHAFTHAGYLVMRSSWRRDANYLCFDAGPLGAGHVHQDKLHLVIWAWGREVLYDSGGGNYEHSKWRRYATDTFSHNTVLVDGSPQQRGRQSPTRRLKDVRWKSTDEFDFAAGVYDDKYGGSRPAVHNRRVLFVKPDLFVVADTLTPRDRAEHTYQARWHLIDPGCQPDKATQAVATGGEGKANLVVAALLTEGLKVRAASAKEKPEILGWFVEKWGSPARKATTTVLHTRKGAGVQQFLTLFVPLRRGVKNPLKAVRPVGANAAEVTFADGRKLVIGADADPKGAIGVEETLRNGKSGRKVSAR